MDYVRIARKMIENQDDETLLELLKLSSEETDQEGVTVCHMIRMELRKRKLIDSFVKGRISDEQFESRMKAL